MEYKKIAQETNTYSVQVSYLVPQNYRGFVDATSEADAIAQVTEAAKKQGYVAFKVDKITLENLEDTPELDAGIPTDAKFN